MQDIYDYIDAHAGRAVADLQNLLRQPSVSAQNIGLDECAELLRRQIVEHGFDDIEILVHTARKNPYKTPVREAISRATIRAAGQVFGEQPVVMGVSIQGIIKIHVPHPAVLSGFGAPENNLHAPNENMPVARYIQGIKFAATIFDEFARYQI